MGGEQARRQRIGDAGEADVDVGTPRAIGVGDGQRGIDVARGGTDRDEHASLHALGRGRSTRYGRLLLASPRVMRVTMVVLGDLGRSPRMQYHAEALAAHHVDVDVVACAGTRAHAALHDHPRITCHLLPAARERRLPRALRLPVALGRAVIQALRLVWMLLAVVRKSDVILVQNPPAVPTMLVALVAARLRGARLVVDWHNLAWAMLALGAGARHPVVAAARWYEGVVGRRADAHLCVSTALAGELARWGM